MTGETPLGQFRKSSDPSPPKKLEMFTSSLWKISTSAFGAALQILAFIIHINTSQWQLLDRMLLQFYLWSTDFHTVIVGDYMGAVF